MTADIIQQSLQVGTIGRPTGISAVIISRPDQGPAGMGLTLYIGRGCVVLRIERVELLIQPVVGGDPGWIAQRTALITGVFMTEPLLQVDLPYP